MYQKNIHLSLHSWKIWDRLGNIQETCFKELLFCVFAVGYSRKQVKNKNKMFDFRNKVFYFERKIKNTK